MVCSTYHGTIGTNVVKDTFVPLVSTACAVTKLFRIALALPSAWRWRTVFYLASSSLYFWAGPLLSALSCKHITLLITVIAYVLRVYFFFSLQVWFFHSCAISATRFYVQDERQITTDPCDNRLIVLFETWGVCKREYVCGMSNVYEIDFFISELFTVPWFFVQIALQQLYPIGFLCLRYLGHFSPRVSHVKKFNEIGCRYCLLHVIN